VEGPGGMFGELAMFDPELRTATATAVTDATLAGLAPGQWRQIEGDYKDLQGSFND
jgi:CRP-like cAMP-binding protein